MNSYQLSLNSDVMPVNVPVCTAYKVQTNAQLKRFNELFGLPRIGLEVFCYPALYVVMFGSFITVDIKKEEQYEKLGYYIVQI